MVSEIVKGVIYTIEYHPGWIILAPLIGFLFRLRIEEFMSREEINNLLKRYLRAKEERILRKLTGS